MPTWDDVRRIGLALPEVTEGTRWGRQALLVRGSSFTNLRPLSKRNRGEFPGGEPPTGTTLLVSTDDVGAKAALLASTPAWCFDIPHLDGYPAALVVLDDVPLDALTELVQDAWAAAAPDDLVAAWVAEHPVE